MSDERESVRGLDEFGIPAPLLHAVGARLKQDVWGKGGPTEEWILLANAEAFYSWARKSKITRIRVRSAGPQASEVCRELCALLDVGDPSVVLRAGFVEVKWTWNPEFFFAHIERKRRGAVWNDVFWRICEGHGGQIACTWRTPSEHVHRFDMLTNVAQCSVFCPGEAIAWQMREDFNAKAIEASREATVTNRIVHSPHIARFVKEADRFESDIIVTVKCTFRDIQMAELNHQIARLRAAKDFKPAEIAKLAEELATLRCQVSKWPSICTSTVNGKSSKNLFLLNFPEGSHLVIRARGPDAESAVAHLAGLVERKFDRDYY